MVGMSRMDYLKRLAETVTEPWLAYLERAGWFLFKEVWTCGHLRPTSFEVLIADISEAVGLQRQWAMGRITG